MYYLVEQLVGKNWHPMTANIGLGTNTVLACFLAPNDADAWATAQKDLAEKFNTTPPTTRVTKVELMESI